MVLRSLYAVAGWRRLAAALALALLLTMAGRAGAQAHAIVVRSDPPDGAVVADAPHEIRIWFSEAIAPQFTQARVLDVTGQAVPGTAFRVDAADPTLLIVTGPELPDGVYNVVLATLSALDGHATQARLVFTVGTGVSALPVAAGPSQPPISPVEVLLRWAGFVALAGMAGAVAVAFILLRPAALPQVPAGGADGVAPDLGAALARARRRVLGWAAACALVALAAGLALFWWQAAALAGPAGAGTTPAAAALRLLAGTQAAALWAYRQALLLVLAALLFILWRGLSPDRPARTPRGAGLILGLFCLAVLALQSLAGHAVTVSPNTTLAILADVLHLAAASFWVGGLLALAVGLLPLALAQRQPPAFAALAQAGWGPFGALAALSVGLLAASGLYSMGRQVASLDAMLTTLYGRALILKLALVLGVGAFGLLNSSLLHPRLAAPLARLLRRPRGWAPLPLARLPALVIAESSLGLLVLLVASIMLTTAPAHGPAVGQGRDLAPDLPASIKLNQQAGDLAVTFQADPNQPGRNAIDVQVSERRNPPAEVLRVILRFSYLEQNLGVVSADARNVFQAANPTSSDGLWQLQGDQLSLPGAWQIDVVVRRRGLEDSTARFRWTVSAPGPAQGPVIVSDRPLEPVLTLAAAAVLAVVLVTALALWLRRSHSAAPRERPARG